MTDRGKKQNSDRESLLPYIIADFVNLIFHNPPTNTIVAVGRQFSADYPRLHSFFNPSVSPGLRPPEDDEFRYYERFGWDENDARCNRDIVNMGQGVIIEGQSALEVFAKKNEKILSYYGSFLRSQVENLINGRDVNFQARDVLSVSQNIGSLVRFSCDNKLISADDIHRKWLPLLQVVEALLDQPKFEYLYIEELEGLKSRPCFLGIKYYRGQNHTMARNVFFLNKIRFHHVMDCVLYRHTRRPIPDRFQDACETNFVNFALITGLAHIFSLGLDGQYEKILAYSDEIIAETSKRRGAEVSPIVLSDAINDCERGFNPSLSNIYRMRCNAHVMLSRKVGSKECKSELRHAAANLRNAVKQNNSGKEIWQHGSANIQISEAVLRFAAKERKRSIQCFKSAAEAYRQTNDYQKNLLIRKNIFSDFNTPFEDVDLHDDDKLKEMIFLE